MRHTSYLVIFPFKKISRLHSAWARLALRAITLEPPFPALDLGQSLEECPTSLQLKHVPLNFPLTFPSSWLPLKGAPFFTKSPLGLKPKPWNCLGFSFLGLLCPRFHSPSWRGFFWKNLLSLFNPNFSPRPTSEKPSTFMMASDNEEGQFSSNFCLAQVGSPITNLHMRFSSCMCRISSMSSE